MFGKNKENIIAKYGKKINQEQICSLICPRLETLNREFWQDLIDISKMLPTKTTLSERGIDLKYNFQNEVITIGEKSDLNEKEHLILDKYIKTLIPWRKGPFNIFGHEIDAEWKSNLKWDRLLPAIGDLSKKRIADVGCNNGYYVFRMLGEAQRQGCEVDCVLGLDPSEFFYFSFHLFQHFINHPRIDYLLLGAENMNLFPEFFDYVFCLGVIYHQRDPINMLSQLKASMKKGGKLILETQTYPTTEPVAFFAPDRYAKSRNTYFIPSVNCLFNWLARLGFKNVDLISEVYISNEEQRKTSLSPYDSWENFFDPSDPTKTIEGYPSPKRAILVCEK